jgi:hypothetical protein
VDSELGIRKGVLGYKHRRRVDFLIAGCTQGVAAKTILTALECHDATSRCLKLAPPDAFTRYHSRSPGTSRGF